jgi:hypothetical protein
MKVIESGSQRRWQALTHDADHVSPLGAVLGRPDSIFGSGTKVLRRPVAWEGAGQGGPGGPIPSLERQLNSVAACSEDERLGSGDGERKTLLTRQITFEPLPASVLFGRFGLHCDPFIRR